jgi:hypothetical protein
VRARSGSAPAAVRSTVFTSGLAEGNSDGFPQIHSAQKAICRRSGISREKACEGSPLLGGPQGRDQPTSARTTAHRPRILGTATQFPPLRGRAGRLSSALGTARRPLFDLQKETRSSARGRSLSSDQADTRSSLHKMQCRPWPVRRGHRSPAGCDRLPRGLASRDRRVGRRHRHGGGGCGKIAPAAGAGFARGILVARGEWGHQSEQGGGRPAWQDEPAAWAPRPAGTRCRPGIGRSRRSFPPDQVQDQVGGSEGR